MEPVGSLPFSQKLAI